MSDEIEAIWDEISGLRADRRGIDKEIIARITDLEASRIKHGEHICALERRIEKLEKCTEELERLRKASLD